MYDKENHQILTSEKQETANIFTVVQKINK